MPLERSNPLPAGRYWLNVGPSDTAAFDAWLGDYEALGSIRVENTSQLDGGWNFVLFSVIQPVPWNGPGFPDIADDSVKTYADTITSPPIAGPQSVLESVENMARNVAWGAFGLLALYVLLSNRRS